MEPVGGAAAASAAVAIDFSYKKPTKFSRIGSIIYDILSSNVFYVIPNAFKWCYQRYWTKTIQSFPLKNTVDKTAKVGATLYQHGNLDEQLVKENHAILLLHGDNGGHPFSTLPLAEVAQKTKRGPVFSIYLSYDDKNPEKHHQLLRQAIDKIVELIEGKGFHFSGITLAGHSKGGIVGAEAAFVHKDKRIEKVISVAGRLNDFDDVPCNPAIREAVRTVYKAIIDNPKIPLYQIVGDKDWNAPLKATAVRNAEDPRFCRVVKGAYHLDLVYKPETKDAFKAFLEHA